MCRELSRFKVDTPQTASAESKARGLYARLRRSAGGRRRELSVKLALWPEDAKIRHVVGETPCSSRQPCHLLEESHSDQTIAFNYPMQRFEKALVGTAKFASSLNPKRLNSSLFRFWP